MAEFSAKRFDKLCYCWVARNFGKLLKAYGAYAILAVGVAADEVVKLAVINSTLARGACVVRIPKCGQIARVVRASPVAKLQRTVIAHNSPFINSVSF